MKARRPRPGAPQARRTSDAAEQLAEAARLLSLLLPEYDWNWSRITGMDAVHFSLSVYPPGAVEAVANAEGQCPLDCVLAVALVARGTVS